ncbi:MAG: helix-turn-helix domain-containing protein [Candidatus Woesearchaeota archaeon]
MEFACKKIDVQDIIACSLGLKKSEYKVFEALLRNDHVTLKDLSRQLNLDRTTLQKVLKNFVNNDLVARYQENLDSGGYVFVYKIKDKSVLKKRIHAAIDKWHATAKQAIDRW